MKYALDNGAKVILASHLGKPQGQRPKESLKPVVKRLSELLNVNVKFVDDCIGDSVIAATNELKNGEVLLLENLRFYKEEEKNDPEFAENLSKLADVYVNDAFATAHRAHASTAGMVKYFKEAAGGFTLKSELGYFEKAFSNPERPLVAIFGGAKVSTKISAIRNVAKRANRIIVGGAMANTFSRQMVTMLGNLFASMSY